ncbi:MAG: PLP-dependent aminotransferase family protein [Oscillospiraceae bacterium]|nr:PLP-dependent aminotransferase family protein [Oscillospiraceae bacterium]
MNYTVNKTGEFAYLQLYRALRQDITDGRLPYGSKLPSKRLLSEESGASIITVEHAYAILCDEGYAEARARSGYYVIYREGELAAPPVHTEQPPRRQTALRSDFPFSVLARTMRRVLSERGAEILQRSSSRGCEELRQALCAYLARSSGISVQPQQIVIGAGAEYLYSLVPQLLGREQVFALEQPGYPKIGQVYAAQGVNTVQLPLEADGIESAALWGCDAAVLHVTPFHSYPSGVTASASKRREYLRWAKQRGGYIVEDNYDSELTVSKKNEDTLFSQSEEGRVIYINTFSQTVSPALRVGYMVLPQSLVQRYRERLGFYACTVPVFEQLVLAALLQSGDFERHINRVRRARRKALKQN